MKKIGIIFPGQGSQSLGMGKELYDHYRVVQEFFELASTCLETNFVKLCFASSDRELRETANAQTSIFLLSLAISELLKQQYGIIPSLVAGHSSGEYAALVAAGGMSFPDALYLLKKRAEFMENATKQSQGGMLAVLGLSYKQIADICAKYDDSLGNEIVAQVVNHNTPGQLVVSGTLDALDRVKDDVIAAGGRAIVLNVSGAFHSRLMNDAAEKFALYMVKVDFKDLEIPLVNNIKAELITTSQQVKESLEKQLNSNVQWWPSMLHFKECDVIIQVGPSDIYANMIRREWPDKQIVSINTLRDIKNLLTIVGREQEFIIPEELIASTTAPAEISLES